MAKNKGRPENLIPLTVNDERAREIRSKGGKARVQKLHERKKMREDLGNLLKITLCRGDIVDPEDIMNMEEAEDLYFGLGFILRDLKKVIEETRE